MPKVMSQAMVDLVQLVFSSEVPKEERQRRFTVVVEKIVNEAAEQGFQKGLLWSVKAIFLTGVAVIVIAMILGGGK